MPEQYTNTENETKETQPSVRIEVPDFIRAEYAPKEEVSEEVGALALGQTVKVERFMGDPRRVPGHPANLTNDMAKAYAKRRESTED